MVNKERLDELYEKFNQQKYLSPDPLEVVARYEDPRDKEVVAFIAAMLAYGRVASIVKNVDKVLRELGEHPAEFLVGDKGRFLDRGLEGFKHRWTTREEVQAMLIALRAMLRLHGSLEAGFAEGVRSFDESIIPAMATWTRALDRRNCRSLISKPEKGSACKRLHMFMRWMVRKDEIDLGLWTQVKPEQLIVPLDTHMFRVCKAMGMTLRKQPNYLAAKDITEAFKRISPEDPVKYDFALTRLGIRKDESMRQFLLEQHILKR